MIPHNPRITIALAILAGHLVVVGTAARDLRVTLRADFVTRHDFDSVTDADLFEKIWTVGEGLGPQMNAQSCHACHARPTRGGASSNHENFVIVSPESPDPSGGNVFRLFQVQPNGRTTPNTFPRQIARRRPPSLFGLGMLEAVPHEGRTRKGRFGWKARFESLDAAVAAAFANELGLLSREFSGGARAEITDEQVRAVSQFVRQLPAPPRKVQTPDGDQLFASTGCATCHVPTLITGDSPIPALRFQTIHPYTDMALHDMGPALSDGWDDGAVRGSEFRTPPLWGLSEVGPPYLHDGRAATLDQAIELHGGDAATAGQRYRALSGEDRKRLLAFVGGL